MKTYVSLSFDDARQDSYRAIKIANSYGLKATLNVTSSYVDSTCPEDCLPCNLPAMSIDQVLELASQGNEIACHGHYHNNQIDSILEGEKIVRNWLRLDPAQKLGFASPHSGISLDEQTVSLMRDRFSYLRIVDPLAYAYFIEAVKMLKGDAGVALT